MKLLTRDSFWIGLWALQVEQRPVLRRRDQGGRGPGRGSERQESLRPTSRARCPPRPDMGLYQAPSFPHLSLIYFHEQEGRCTLTSPGPLILNFPQERQGRGGLARDENLKLTCAPFPDLQPILIL